MKARIKGTDTIVECLRLDEDNKRIYCKYINGEFAGICDRIQSDCLVEIENDFDWQSFRNHVAKDILCAMIRNEGVADERNVDEFTKDNQVKDAVLYADKLIAKLNLI